MFSAFKRILCVIIAFFIGFATYPLSFVPSAQDSDFTVKTGDFTMESVIFNGEAAEISVDGCGGVNSGAVSLNPSVTVNFNSLICDWFNYYAISYCSDSYVKGVISYKAGVKAKSEEFFLEPSAEEKTFYSFIDNNLDGVKANCVESLTFTALDKTDANFRICGVSTFNREIPETEIYVSNEHYKIGVNLLWGGALSYMEDLDSNVQAVNVDGKIKVDSNASARYNAESVNNNVNLINRCDTGRLVQQSYYGTNGGGYECGEYMGNKWSYNPVQGGNQFNENSKIVDYRAENGTIYIKCRPLDWAKSKEDITPSYMEATYKIEGELVHASCRFVDFSGYPEAVRTQELPAFYCVEPLNRYVYYGGSEPWTDGELTVVPDLIFWPDAGYPNFTSSECWSAFIGDFDDSFGIGLYVPNETVFLSGVFSRGGTTNVDPSIDGPTSYIALVKNMVFRSYSPLEYDFYLSSGNVTQIRNNFSAINK